VIPPVLLDVSAWARLQHPALSAERKAELIEAAESLHFRACVPFLLEAGFTGRDALDHRRMMGSLRALPRVEMDPGTEALAVEAQGQLASVGHHRIPPADILVAALADQHELGVLHYDHHYDQLAEKTELSFESVWLSEPGSL
jgi:predicted nucleic acid-binding protein